MPVSCAIDFPRLSKDEMRDVDYLVMRQAFDIHSELGCLCDETVYQNQLAIKLRSAGLQADCEVPVEVSFRSFFKTLFLDLVVNRSVIYELKTVAKIAPAQWAGTSCFSSMIEELVSDWGTGLDQSLYADAIIHELGGAEAVTYQLPMHSNGISLGNQRFHLLDDKTAFRVTTFQKPSVGQYETSIRKLLVPSPLSSIHWVNIARREVLLRSIPR